MPRRRGRLIVGTCPSGADRRRRGAAHPGRSRAITVTSPVGRRGDGVGLGLVLAGRHPAAVDEEHAAVVEAERHEHLERRRAAVRAVAGEELVVGEVRRRSRRNREPLVAGVELVARPG